MVGPLRECATRCVRTQLMPWANPNNLRMGGCFCLSTECLRDSESFIVKMGCVQLGRSSLTLLAASGWPVGDLAHWSHAIKTFTACLERMAHDSPAALLDEADAI